MRSWLYRRVIFGKLEKPDLMHITDMNGREMLALYPLIVLTIFFGFYPAPILDVFAASVDQLMSDLAPPGNTAGSANWAWSR